MARKQSKKNFSESLTTVVIHSIFVIFTLSVIYPFWTVLMDSVSSTVTSGIKVLPKGFTLDAYALAFSQRNVASSFGNTIFRTVLGTALCTVSTFCAAYVISKRSIPFIKLMTLYVLLPMFFSGGLIPLYLQIQRLGLIDNRLGLVLPFVFNGFYIMVTRNFIYSIPGEIEESALIDGANEVIIAFKIYLPLSIPIIATIALWAAVYQWNEWFYAMIYIRDPKKQVMQVLLRRVLMESQISAMMDDPSVQPKMTEKSLRSALLFISTIPILAVYPFAQKYFIRGLTTGAVKG